MANEFIARNGLIAQNNSVITGSLEITGSQVYLKTNGFIVENVDLNASLIEATTAGGVYVWSTNSNPSADFENRQLLDENGNASVVWTTQRTLEHDNGPVLDWANQTLNDYDTLQSVNWTNRYLYDSSGVSIDWGNRYIYDQNYNPMIAYGGGDGLNIVNYRPTIENLSLVVQDDFTQNSVLDLNANAAGNIIQAGPNIDLAVTASNPVFLDTDGIWKRSDQTTDATTKLLGICVEPYNKGYILTEGIITVTTASGYPDTMPFVSGSSFYGMPVYLTGSAAAFTTTKPTSGYVRVVGHIYYNSTSTPDYWIMKFNPSNDWYEI
jgi:hypothetical protein